MCDDNHLLNCLITVEPGAILDGNKKTWSADAFKKAHKFKTNRNTVFFFTWSSASGAAACTSTKLF